MLNLLGPYKYVVDFLVIAVLVGLAAFGVHKYNVYQQDIGAARVQDQWDKAVILAKDAQRQREIQFQKEKDDAIAQAAKSAQVSAAAATAATASGRVLQSTIETILARSGTDTADANRKYTAALAAVLTECTGAYREMARTADGHALDAQTLSNAWPK
jgi:hypothetical protein